MLLEAPSLDLDIPKKKEKVEQWNGEMRFFKNIFYNILFLTFVLSYSIYSIITISGTQQVSLMGKYCVKVGIACRFILY